MRNVVVLEQNGLFLDVVMNEMLCVWRGFEMRKVRFMQGSDFEFVD